MWKKKIKASNMARRNRWVNGTWSHQALKYDQHYFQKTCLGAGININIFSFICLIIILSDMAKVRICPK
jgi:hypothetical protein